jgi:hypothetical protein
MAAETLGSTDRTSEQRGGREGRSRCAAQGIYRVRSARDNHRVA